MTIQAVVICVHGHLKARWYIIVFMSMFAYGHIIWIDIAHANGGISSIQILYFSLDIDIERELPVSVAIALQWELRLGHLCWLCKW